MDPYLEGDLWTTFHAQMAAEIARPLEPKIAPRYVALTEERYVVDSPDDMEVAIESRIPVVGIVETKKRGGRRGVTESFNQLPLEYRQIPSRH
jgi:hypothetical protein